MGIRRRRKKINTILTTIDRRLKSVELQRVPRVVKDGTITRKMLEKSIQIDLAASTDSSKDTPGTTAPRPPEFKDRPLTNIVEIRYKGYNEAGTANDRDQALVVFETDPGLNVGDKLRFASLRDILDVPSKTSTYTVESVGTATFGGQTYKTALYRPGRTTIVDGTITYNKGWRIRKENVTLPSDSLDAELDKYKYWQIKIYTSGVTPSTDNDTLYGPTWPAGVPTTEGVHMVGSFAIGKLINIVGLGDPFDGVHKIINYTRSGSEIVIKLEFKTYLASVTLPTSDGAVRGAAGRYLRDGETWTDLSFTPPVVWIWDEAKQLWRNSAELPEGTVIDDGIAPSPPTNVTGTSEGYLSPDNQPYSRVELSWTAPTTNADSTNLSDLKGYKVYYRYSTNEDWVLATDVAGTSATVQDLVPETVVYFAVKAYDVSNNLSAFSQTYSITTVKAALVLGAPSAPVFTSRLGTVKVTWNGLDSTGSTPPVGYLRHVEVHYSTTTNFTPSSSTLKGILRNVTDFYNDIDPEYDTNYYFKFVFVDAFGVKSTPSAQTVVTVEPLVDTDLIEGSLSRWPFGANTIDVDSLADGSIAATYLVSGSDAAGTAVRTEGKIAAGSIGAVAIAANSIVAGKIAANAVTADTIAALSISAGKIAANAITADKIAAGTITAEKLAAGTITGEIINGGLITGARLRTAASGERVEIGQDTFGTISFYSSAGTRIGGILGMQITDEGGTVANWIRLDSSYVYVNDYMSVGGTLNVYGFSTFTDTLNVTGVTRLGNSGFEVDSSGVYSSRIHATTTSLAYNMHIQGSGNNYKIYRSTFTSTRELKRDIRPLEFDQEAYINISPVVFKYVDGVLREEEKDWDIVGFIAEDFVDAGLAEHLVAQPSSEDEYISIRYDKMYMFLHEVVRAQNEKIKNLTTRITALESK